MATDTRFFVTIREETAEHDSSAEYTFFDYAPRIFHQMREMSGFPSKEYLKSLEPSQFLSQLDNQKFSEGRSGSFFIFSPDKKIILKSIPESEAKLLKAILPDLYQHLFFHPESLIVRFWGLHAIQMPQGEKIFVVVMQNMFNSVLSIDERYDLKGSWINREVGKSHEENPSQLGMDKDLHRKLSLNPDDRKKFIDQIELDAEFFRRLNIMDYSLLVGFHFVRTEGFEDKDKWSGQIQNLPSHVTGVDFDQENELAEGNSHFARRFCGGLPSQDGTVVYFLGVIDVLQLYNAQKKGERLLKVYLLQKDSKGVSVQPPTYYAHRFVEQMKKLLD